MTDFSDNTYLTIQEGPKHQNEETLLKRNMHERMYTTHTTYRTILKVHSVDIIYGNPNTYLQRIQECENTMESNTIRFNQDANAKSPGKAKQWS